MIAVLMAVYEPRLDWLTEQLQSLNAQSYPNLRLYVRDDCSPTVDFETVRALVEQCITAFPFTVERSERNLGSTGTFERLTMEAEGDFFAYCDQDDIWLPEKLAVSEEQIGSAGLICGDVIPVDAKGNRLADSITTLRPRILFRQGAGLGEGLIYRNFVIGCTMLIRSNIAKAAVPFAQSMVHDHYLAWFCAQENEIAVAKQPLLYYRLHEGNQTGVLSNIATKQDYLRFRLGEFLSRISDLSERSDGEELKRAAAWAQARCDNAAKKWGAIGRLWAMRRVDIATTLFEIVGLRLPDPLFRWAIRRIRSGKPGGDYRENPCDRRNEAAGP